MNFEQNGTGNEVFGGYAGFPHAAWDKLRVDGLDGQEDELEDVEKGKLDPPTNDEGRGSIDEKNERGRRVESEDEDDGLLERVVGRGGSGDRTGLDEGGAGSRSDDEAMEELADKAGIRLPN